MFPGTAALLRRTFGACECGALLLVLFFVIVAIVKAGELPQIPDRPARLTVDEKSGLLYIFGQDNGEVLVVDPREEMKPVFGTKLFEMPEDALYDPAQEKIYELHYLLGILAVFDAKAIAAGKAPVPRWYYLPDGEKGAERNGMALDAGRNRLWIIYTNFNAQALYLFDTRRETVRKVMMLKTPAVSFTVDPGTGDLFLQHTASPFVTRIDGDTFESNEIRLPDIAGEMYLDRFARTLYVLGPHSGKVFAYDIAFDRVREISLGDVSASMITGIPSQNRLYAISKFGKPNVSVIDTVSRSVVRTIDLPSAPFQIIPADNLGMLGIVTAENTFLALSSAGSIVREIPLPPMHALGSLWGRPRLPVAYDSVRSNVYIASAQLNALTKINLRTFESESYNWPPAVSQASDSESLLPGRPVRDFMASEIVRSIGDKIFVLNYGGFVTVFDSRLYRTLARLELAPVLNWMAFDGGKIYVSSAYAKKLYRIDPDTYSVEKEYSLPGLPATFWHLVPSVGTGRILVVDIWGGKFAFLDVESGEIEFEGAAAAGVVRVMYNGRSREAIFVTRERGLLRVNPERKSVEELALPGRIPDFGPYFASTDFSRTDLMYLAYFDGKAQRVVGVNTRTGKIESDFSVADIPHTRYDVVTDIVFNPKNNRILVAFPGRLAVYSPEGSVAREYIFDGYGRKVIDDGGLRAGPISIFGFIRGKEYEIFLVMGTKIMRVDPNTYKVSLPLETLKDESEGMQAIGLLGTARRILPDPDKNKLYIIYNYDAMAVYDFASGRVWLRANPDNRGLSWSAYHIISPLAPGDEPQPQVPPWVTRERNMRIAAVLFGGLLFSAAAYAVWRTFMRKKETNA